MLNCSLVVLFLAVQVDSSEPNSDLFRREEEHPAIKMHAHKEQDSAEVVSQTRSSLHKRAGMGRPQAQPTAGHFQDDNVDFDIDAYDVDDDDIEFLAALHDEHVTDVRSLLMRSAGDDQDLQLVSQVEDFGTRTGKFSPAPGERRRRNCDPDQVYMDGETWRKRNKTEWRSSRNPWPARDRFQEFNNLKVNLTDAPCTSSDGQPVPDWCCSDECIEEHLQTIDHLKISDRNSQNETISDPFQLENTTANINLVHRRQEYLKDECKGLGRLCYGCAYDENWDDSDRYSKMCDYDTFCAPPTNQSWCTKCWLAFPPPDTYWNANNKMQLEHLAHFYNDGPRDVPWAGTTNISTQKQLVAGDCGPNGNFYDPYCKQGDETPLVLSRRGICEAKNKKTLDGSLDGKLENCLK